MNHSNNSAANNGNKLTLRTQIDGLPVDRAKGVPAKSAVSVSVVLVDAEDHCLLEMVTDNDDAVAVASLRPPRREQSENY